MWSVWVALAPQVTEPPVTGLHPDRILAALARRQHGVVSSEQLLLHGFTHEFIQRLVRSGHLHRLHRGVYAVGHINITWKGHCAAAALTCGLNSLVSHTNAAVLHNFMEVSAGFHVSAPTRRRHPGVLTHEVRTLTTEDRALVDGIPLTSPARTLLDLATALPRHQFTRAYEEADRIHLVNEVDARSLLSRCNGHRGSGLLAAMLDETFAHPPTRSELERLFYELPESAGLPVPQVNVWVEGCRVDAYWPTHRLVVELDSVTYHRTDAKIERDYATSAKLKLAGYEVLRFTWKQVTRRPELVVDLLRKALEG